MRLQSIVAESIVDGPGIRFVVFVQGCPHRCPGCHNPQTHDPAGGYECTPTALVKQFRACAADNPLLDGVTLSGGEPLEQAAALIPLVEAAHGAGLDVWLYSGYTLEEIQARDDRAALDLLGKIDVLVDGRFDPARRTLEERFVGSTNQRIIHNPVNALAACA